MCPVFSTEDCDGVDNDHNGKVDDGEVCPDPTVASTMPLVGGVYLQGTLHESACGLDALQRFWPTQATTYFTGFDCYAESYRFRRTDNSIFYEATFEGIRQNDDASDPLVPTPPCDADAGEHFDFDGTGALYYQCRDVVLKGRGVAVTYGVATLVATLDDGRVLVTRPGADGQEYVVVDGSGTELSHLPPPPELAGVTVAFPQATTVTGNHAYAAFDRQYPVNQREIVVYHLDDHSQWTRVRRVIVPDFGYMQLVLSDGTVLVRGNGPPIQNGEQTEQGEQIVAFLPDGTSQVAWREVDQPLVRAHGGEEMLLGPP